MPNVTLPATGVVVATNTVGGAEQQVVQVASSALPAGAATAVGQAAIVAAIADILGGPSDVSVNNFPSTQAVSLATPVALDSAALAALESITVQSSALPTGAATETTLAALNTKTPALGQAAAAASSPVVLASDQAMIPVNTLAQPGVARKLAAAAAGGASANVALTASVRRISICATGSALRYAIGTGAQTASSTSHYIQAGERLDLAVPASAQIAVLSDTATVGALEISELT